MQSTAPHKGLQGQPAAPQQQHEAWQDYQSVFTAAKAGMEGVDKEKVKKIVYEMSKDSAHFKNEQRKQALVDAKIQQLQAQAAALSPSDLTVHQRAARARMVAMDAARDLTRTWLHIDMDAFYAAVEQREQPALAQVPMAVGGIGMICTANYEARKYGVRSAMPGFIARKLCPHLVFVKTDFTKYTAASEETRAIFRCYDPVFEAGSLDEAYLDVTDYCREQGVTGAQVAELIRSRMRTETRLTCSAGVAPNKRLAKVCSDINKPDGQYVLPASRDAVLAFISSLPIRKVPGIGKVQEQTLTALGVSRCGQLLEQCGLLAALFSPVSQEFFWQVGLGLGSTRHPEPVAPGQVTRKGISCERTFGNMSDPADLQAMLVKLTDNLAADMASESLEARTLTLKLKTSAFEVRTRASSLPTYVHTSAELLPILSKLLAAELPIEVRLMGVRASNLQRRGAVGSSNALLRMLGKAPAHAASGGGGHAVGSGNAAAAEAQQQHHHHHQQQQQQQQQRGEEDTGSPTAGGGLDFGADMAVAGAAACEGQLLTQQQMLGEELLSLECQQEEVGASHAHHQREEHLQELAAEASVAAAAAGAGGWAPEESPPSRSLSGGWTGDGLVHCKYQQEPSVPAGLHHALRSPPPPYHQRQQHQHQHQHQHQQELWGVGKGPSAPSSPTPTGSVPGSTSSPNAARGAAGEGRLWGPAGLNGPDGWVTPSVSPARTSSLHRTVAAAAAADTDQPMGVVRAERGDGGTAFAGILHRRHLTAAAPAEAVGLLEEGGAPRRRSWTCSVCTYAGNPARLLRCEMCDTPKAGPMSFQPSTAAGQQQQLAGKHRGSRPGGVGKQSSKRARPMQQQDLMQAFRSGS